MPVRITPDLTYDLDERDTCEQGWSYCVAHGVSYLINPLILPPILFGLLLRHYGAPAEEIGWAVAAGFVFFALVPLGYIGWLRWRRDVASIEIPDRSERTRPFVATMGSYGAAMAVTYGVEPTAMPLLLSVAGCYVVNTAFALLINFRWKISVHAISLAGFASILFFVADVPAGSGLVVDGRLTHEVLYGVLPLVPLLMWARVRTRSHSPGQVAAGVLFGLVLPFLELTVLERLHLL